MDLWKMIYPPMCLNCSKGSTWLCDKCFGQIFFIRAQICPGCHKLSENGKRCAKCSLTCAVNQLLATAYYRGILKQLIPDAKYSYKHIFVSVCADWICELIKKEIKYKQACIVPVPADPHRFGKLGYHFSHILARRVAKKLKIPYHDVLRKIKSTSAQVGQNKKTRINQITGTIRTYEEIDEKIIILIDDVFTTGATLNECSKILKTRGRKNVIGVVIARG